MVWLYLIIAGVFEMAWAIGLKYTNGLTRLWPTVFTAVTMMISLYFLAISLRNLPVGTAYAVWTGIGAVGTAILGMILFGEPRTILRILCILLIVAGIAGLRFTSENP